MKYTHKGFLNVAMLLVVVVGLFLLYESKIRSSGEPTRTDLQSTDWGLVINENGAQDAYELLVQSTVSLNPSEAHGQAHSFGKALFEQEGVDGFKVCDSRLSYGCAHEFVGVAISLNGLEVIDEIFEACTTQEPRAGCTHGIGHGLIGYLGYTHKNLQEAAYTCEVLGDSDYVSGCFSGALMEYNMRQLLELEGEATLRPLTNENWHEPCGSFSGELQQACYLWQPQWWWLTLSSHVRSAPEPLLKDLLALCNSKKTPSESRDFCVAGVSQMIPSATLFKPEEIKNLCDSVSREESLICRAFSANVLFNSGREAEAATVCEGLSEAEMDYCIKHTNGFAGAQNMIEVPL